MHLEVLNALGLATDLICIFLFRQDCRRLPRRLCQFQELVRFGSALILALVIVAVLDIGRCIHQLYCRLKSLGYGYLVLEADIP